MARAQGGNRGSVIATVVFLIATVVFAGVSVFLFTRVGGANQAADAAQAKLAAVATNADLNSEEARRLESTKGGASLVRAFINENADLRSLVGGTASAGAGVEDLRTSMIQAQLIAEGDTTLASAIRRLQAELDDAEQRLQSTRRQLVDQRRRAESAAKAAEQVTVAFNSAAEELADDYRQASSAFVVTDEGMDGLREQTTQQFVELRREKDDQISDLQRNLRDRDEEIRNLNRRIDTLIAAGRESANRSNVLPADAFVTSLAYGTGDVYIDIGRAQGVVLGMTFELFDSSTLIKVEDEDDVRGKATIEIHSMTENAAIGRVVRLARGASITPDDQAFNLVFDKNTTYTFHIYGDFDIERTGEVQTGDAKRVADLVRGWNGKVVEGLTYEVDYLVLGEEPKKPEPLPASVIDPLAIEQHLRAVRHYDTYQTLIGQAKDLSIPVLNQNRFLGLIGYYQR